MNDFLKSQFTSNDVIIIVYAYGKLYIDKRAMEVSFTQTVFRAFDCLVNPY